MRLIKLLWFDWSIKLFVPFSVLAFVRASTLHNQAAPFNSPFWIGIGIALLVVPIDQLIKIVKDYTRFRKLEGTYKTYSYQRDVPPDRSGPDNLTFTETEEIASKSKDKQDDTWGEKRKSWINRENKKYNLLNDESVAKAVLLYIGGNEFLITLTEKNPNNVWKGILKLQTTNNPNSVRPKQIG